ncbi:uncharacterized protein LOC100888005 [Strongylocentrotus purpuratus]|uniref:PAW domain-containing protein n=1 Tax=Strongylocentrotus purpuratus TaxID=7668 RepID=A0A7M7GGL3_STRPU|nr:uncharacterized protein LOC100888005 [Strongylocentrotus purpuratus]|eukprot:XP_003727660.1 PREDICTED: uncharacterized protein LOC100888005 [Strongylocentrotus purpuratus]
MDELSGNTDISTRSKRLPKELADEVETPGNIFVLSEEERRAGLFHLRYSAREDAYYRYAQREPALKGWKEGAFNVVNMQRYHAIKGPQIGEWTYLTRKPRHSSGSISWFLDLTQSGLVVDQVYALTYSRTLSGGNVTFDMRRPDCPPSKGHKTESSINGLIFAAYLDGGLRKRERAQTQLFFQDCLEDPEGFPFDLLITLKPSDSKEGITNKPRTKPGPLQPLSFPPRPHDVPTKPARCTCARNHRRRRISASIADFRDKPTCCEQDERGIISSEKLEKGRTNFRPNGVDTCSVTKDINANGSMLLTEPNRTMRSLEATLANPHKRNERLGSDRGNGSINLARTEQNVETSKCPEHGTSRRFSVASTAWEHRLDRGIDNENLVESRRKSRCVIL